MVHKLNWVAILISYEYIRARSRLLLAELRVMYIVVLLYASSRILVRCLKLKSMVVAAGQNKSCNNDRFF